MIKDYYYLALCLLEKCVKRGSTHKTAEDDLVTPVGKQRCFHDRSFAIMALGLGVFPREEHYSELFFYK